MARLTYINDYGNSIEFGQSQPYYLTSAEGLSDVESRITTVKSPTQDGATITGSVLEPRHIVILGEVTAGDQTLRSQLIRVLNPKIGGRLVYTEGTFSKQIYCKPERTPQIGGHTKATAPFAINFFAADPYWKEISETRVDVALWTGALEFPLELMEAGIEIGYRTISTIANINNAGDVSCGLKIEFRAIASVVNPAIYNDRTGEFFKLDATLAAGDVLTVTTHFLNKKVLLESGGVITNGFNLIDILSAFLQLEPGDNSLRYDAESGTIDNLEVSIWFTPQYLGV